MCWQIAIDGPAGAGKSTISKNLARKLGFQYVDTGAMYRAVTLKALRLGINMYENDEYNFLENTAIDLRGDRILLDGEDVTEEIRSLEVSNNVSVVAQREYVRNKLVAIQRALADEKNVIMDGRDIGTVVLPGADLKIFLNATVEERAKRRLEEREAKNQAKLTLADTVKEIIDRDYKDSNRAISPLMKAPDAIEIDSSELSVEAVIEIIINLLLERGYRMENLDLNKKEEQTTEEKAVNETPVEELEPETKPQEEPEAEAKAEEPAEKPKRTRKKKAETEAAEKPAEEPVEKPKKTRKEKAEAESETAEETAEAPAEEKPKRKTAAKAKKEEPKVVQVEEEKIEEAKPEAEVKEEPQEAPAAVAAPEEKPEEAPAEEAKAKEEKSAEEPEAAAEEKPEEAPAEATEESEEDDYPEDANDDEAIQDEYSEDEEDDSEAAAKEKEDKDPAKKYRQLQVVHGKVVEVIEAQPERKIGNRTLKAKEERVLIELEDGQQGFLFRKDTADIAEDQDLFDLFIEGDEITCVIKKIYPDGGKFIFSTVLLKMRSDLSMFQDIIKNHGTFTAKVVRKLSVGYLLKHNEFSCLLPTSQVDVPEEELGNFIGREIEVAPIRIDYGRIRLIVSQKVANAIVKRREKEAFISQIEVGQEFDGVVKNIESYGAFVDIGNGVEGLLHISELDHVRVGKVEKILNPGDEVRVKVIKIDGIHIGLSRKALLPNYWQEYAERHEVGSIVTGKITEINNYGLVVELDEHVSAFLPRSEYAWERDVYISDSAAVGDEIEMKIIEVDPVKRRIILSRKQLTENPWEVLSCRPGDTIEVEVVKELKDGYKINWQGAVGYLPKSGIANYHEEIAVGSMLKVKARVFDPRRTKLVVNMRIEPDRRVAPRARQQEKLTDNLGDLLKSQLKDMKE